MIASYALERAKAALFMDFLFSRSGQGQLAGRTFGTVRPDLPTGIRATVDEDTLRPIRVGPDLLAYLDQTKRKEFFRDGVVRCMVADDLCAR
jgi:iron(III) transport system substrate-binding protein